MTFARLLARIALVCCVAGASIARAQQKDAEARIAYAEGRDAYRAGKYTVALEKFRFSYTLSGQPALLYNISTALQSLNRPGEAADALEAYLKARPDDPDRAALEKRIADLRVSQSISLQPAPAPTATPAPLQGHTGWVSDGEADRLVLEERRRRKKLAIGLGVGLGALAVGGITIGLVCGLGYCSHNTKDYDFKGYPVTK